jgi:hypothetical protein
MDMRPLPKCPNCGTELCCVIEEGTETQSVKIHWIWVNDRYREADEDRDFIDYKCEGYYCPECGRQLDIESVKKVLFG